MRLVLSAAFRSHVELVFVALSKVSECSPVGPNGIPLPVAAVCTLLRRGIPLPLRLFPGDKARHSAPRESGRGIPLPVGARHSAPPGTALRSRGNGTPLPVARRCAPAQTALCSRWHGIVLPVEVSEGIEILNGISHLGAPALSH